MYSSEDLEIKCKSNTMKLASFVEMQPLLSKDFTFSLYWACKYTSFLCDKKIYLPFFSKNARILFVKSLIYNILCSVLCISVFAYARDMVAAFNLFCPCTVG